MKILTAIFTALILIGCNAPKEVVPKPMYTHSINQTLKPYVFEYLAVLEENNIKFKNQSFIVMFDVDMNRSSYAGQARGMFNDNLVFVAINPKAFFSMSEKERMILIFHELSHDVFKIEHTPDIKLMRPKMMSPIEAHELDFDEEVKILMGYIKIKRDGKQK
jgi:hypothetical protein